MEKDPQIIPSYSSNRRWNVMLNVLISLVALVAILIMANYLASRHFHRYRWTTENPNQLSPLTLNLLKTLTNEVEVVIFFNQKDPLGLYSSVSALLKEYQLVCPKLRIKHVDYLRNPTSAVLVKEKYNLTFSSEDLFRDLVVFDSNGRFKIVYDKELYDYDIESVAAGKTKEIKRSNFRGEQMFTSAIVEICEAKTHKAIFVQGHEEHNPADDSTANGYAKFTNLVQQLNVQVTPAILAVADIPSDCQLLIIAGPQQRFQSNELEKIDQFLKRGGRLFLLFSFQHREKSGLEDLMAKWGVRVGGDAIFNLKSSGKGEQIISADPLIITNYPTPGHVVTRHLLRSMLTMVLPRTIESQALGKSDADVPSVESLAATSAETIAVTDFIDGSAKPDLFRDKRGPLSVAVAVQKGTVQGISGDPTTTRIIIVGDSLCFINQMLDSVANRDFAALAVNWLLDRSHLLGGIGPRPIREYRLVMTSAQFLAVRWMLMAGMPGAVLAVGFIVWFKRRK